MKILIIEDESRSFALLKRLLLDIDDTFDVYGPVISLEGIEKELQAHPNYDIIFSDIQLSDGLSFDAFEQVHPTAPIIFTTAYNEYALKAFKCNGIDYLLKPIVPEELGKAIEKAKRMQAPALYLSQLLKSLHSEEYTKYRERFLIPKGDEFIILEAEDINHIKTEGNATKACLNNGTSHVLTQTMSELEQQLNPNSFFRVSRQFIVHIRSIKKIGNFFNSKLILRLKGYPDIKIQISREKSAQLKEWLDR